MISSVANNISALHALGKKMSVTSNNVANIESEGFKKSRAVLKEGIHGDVRVDIEKIDTPGNIIYEAESDGTVREKELSNVDLAEEIPTAMITQRSYEANLKMIKAEDEMLGAVLDILG